MASTLNLYALDVDSPTSRQLNIISETEGNKRRNYLLTRDEKLITTVSTTSASIVKAVDDNTDLIVSAINGLTLGDGGGDAGPVIQLTYPRENLAYNTSPAFSISSGNVAASKIVDVSYLKSINIFYRHDNTTNPALEISLAVMGFYETNSESVFINELKSSGGTLATESLILSNTEFDGTEFEDIMNTDNSVVLYSFSPFRINPSGPTETFNVIDLNVSGIKYIYVKVQGSFSTNGSIVALDLTKLTNVKIFACAQF